MMAPIDGFKFDFPWDRTAVVFGVLVERGTDSEGTPNEMVWWVCRQGVGEGGTYESSENNFESPK
jgi:hypothetical protein